MRSVTGLCIAMGTIAGGYLPSLWGDSGFSLSALVCSAVGAIAGLFAALKLQA